MERTLLKTGFDARELAAALSGLAALLAGVGLVYYFEPTTAGFYPQCVFYKLTGLYCPGCGTARGLHALLHLDVAGAMSYNPLMVLSLPFLLYAGGSAAYGSLAGKDRPRRLLPAWVIWGIFIIIVSYWVLRNVPVYPFILLAPG